jgi:hypothetical protein
MLLGRRSLRRGKGASRYTGESPENADGRADFVLGFPGVARQDVG